MFRMIGSRFGSVAAYAVGGVGVVGLYQTTDIFSSKEFSLTHSYIRSPVFTHRIVLADKDETKINEVTATPERDDKELSEDEKWALKGESCPLCKMALASPCVAEFKVFDTCLEKLKEKYGEEKPPDEEGMECFSGFHACMFANMEFFKKYVEDREAEEQEEQSKLQQNEDTTSSVEVNNIEQGGEETDKVEKGKE